MPLARIIDYQGGGLSAPPALSIPSPTELHTPAVCAFCGRTARSCRWLIGSTETGAFICDECIAIADRALAAHIAANGGKA